MAHVVPFKTNFTTLLVLLALTILTVATAKYVHLGGAGNLILAMVIATCKAGIVFGWFMHLKYDGKMNRVIALCGVAFLALFIFFPYADLDNRSMEQKKNACKPEHQAECFELAKNS